MFCIWYHVMGVDLLGLQKDRIGVLLEQVQGEWRQRSGSPRIVTSRQEMDLETLHLLAVLSSAYVFRTRELQRQHGHFQKVHGPSAAWYDSMGN